MEAQRGIRHPGTYRDIGVGVDAAVHPYGAGTGARPYVANCDVTVFAKHVT